MSRSPKARVNTLIMSDRLLRSISTGQCFGAQSFTLSFDKAYAAPGSLPLLLVGTVRFYVHALCLSLRTEVHWPHAVRLAGM